MTQQWKNLKDAIHRQVYQTALPFPQLYDQLMRDGDLRRRVANIYVNDNRREWNQEAKEILRNNAMTFKKGFQMVKEHRDKEINLRILNYLLPITGFDLSTGAFIPTIEFIGDDDQVRHWKQLVFAGKVIGAYGQTELAHGSDVQRLQTTAVYDPRTDQFVIDSPSVGSCKFWPGLLGRFSTHAVFQVKAKVGEVDLGLQTFVVEIRDENLNDVANVETFDIGPKLGFEKVDNGGIYFRGKRVPRRAMLMRFVQVSKEGVVNGLQNKEALKYAYGSMLNLRVKLVYIFSIAFTYLPSTYYYALLKEYNLLNTPALQHIVESTCLGLSIIFGNKYPGQIYTKYVEELTKKNYSNADKHLIKCHIMSATNKALCSRIGVQTTALFATLSKESSFKSSFLPYLFQSAVPSTTYEGDNTVLLQQTAKYLLIKYQPQQLVEPKPVLKVTDYSNAIRVLNYMVHHQIIEIKGKMNELSEKGIGFKAVWNELMQRRLIEVSELWGVMTLLKCMVVVMKEIKLGKGLELRILEVATSRLLRNVKEFALYGVQLEGKDVWKIITLQQLDAISQINQIYNKEISKFQLTPREPSWLHSKL